MSTTRITVARVAINLLNGEHDFCIDDLYKDMSQPKHINELIFGLCNYVDDITVAPSLAYLDCLINCTEAIKYHEGASCNALTFASYRNDCDGLSGPLFSAVHDILNACLKYCNSFDWYLKKYSINTMYIVFFESLGPSL